MSAQTGDIIARESQQLAQDAIIELFTLDLSNWGAGELHFTPDDSGQVGVVFDGVEYHSLPCKIGSVEFSGQGVLPTPELTIAALDYEFMAQISGADDLVGATLKRTKTYLKCLDGQPDGGLAESWPTEHWTISQMTEQSDLWVVYQLKVAFDQQNIQVPSHQCLTSCTHRYRWWDADKKAFRYDGVTCPYMDDKMYDAAGNATTDPSKDVCSMQLNTGCKKRYGDNPLPFSGCPSLRSSSS